MYCGLWLIYSSSFWEVFSYLLSFFSISNNNIDYFFPKICEVSGISEALLHFRCFNPYMMGLLSTKVLKTYWYDHLQSLISGDVKYIHVYPTSQLPPAPLHWSLDCKAKLFIKSIQFYLFRYKCFVTNIIDLSYNLKKYTQYKHVWKPFEVGCLHQHTVIALQFLDKNKKLLEIFAYPSNNCSFYEPELNL